MKKSIIIATLLLVAAGGFLAGKLIYGKNEATKILQVGVSTSDKPEIIVVKNELTNVSAEDQVHMDNFLVNLRNASPLKGEFVPDKHPDAHIKLLSPRVGTGLYDAKVWFTENGTILGERAGESWDHMKYKVLPKGGTEIIQGLLNTVHKK